MTIEGPVPASRSAAASLVLIAILCAIPLAAVAEGATGAPVMAANVGPLGVADVWARAAPPNAGAAAGYLTIRNDGASDDRLIEATSTDAGRVEIHEMTMVGDTMRMRPLADGLAVPAGATVQLAPGGLHLMFLEPGAAFKAGGTVSVRLRFEKAGAVDLVLPVAPIGAKAAPARPGHGG